MEMQLSRILYTLILIMLFSCKGEAQNKEKKQNNVVTKDIESINFFDNKYINSESYTLLIDESNISDHPIFSYLDVKEEGYFTVHFIPKNDSLIQFWKKQFFKNYDFNNINLKSDNKNIQKILSGKYDEYNIFCFQVPKEYLKSNSKDYTLESTFLADNSTANIFLYDKQLNKWIKLKQFKTEFLPPFANNNFFINQFPIFFKKTETVKYSIPNGYYALKTQFINLSNIQYEILVLEDKKKKNMENVQHNSLSVVILKQNKKINQNDNIIFKYDNNCPADGFTDTIVKSNYFTIEQSYCKDFMFVKSYTTFKIDEKSGSIYLYKYGEEYTDRSNPDKIIPSKIRTTKDFGQVKFEDITEEFLIKLL